MEAPSSGKKVKRQFFLIYLLSLLLIFVVVSAFWKTSSPETVAAEPVNDDALRFMQIDTLLHNQLAAFDTKVSQYLKSKNAGDLTAAQRQASLLQQAIDSIDRQAAILLDGPRKQFMLLAVGHFKSLMSERSAILYSGADLPAGGVAAVNASVNTSASAEIDRLQQLLAQKEERIQSLEQLSSASGQDKDKLIASLQTQLKEKEAALQQKSNSPSAAPGQDAEWRQKYASLKAAFDKASASEKALKAAYRTVAEDNRRLLNQLQTLRAEKKN